MARDSHLSLSSAVPSVPVLLGRCGPPAIAGLVVPVVIDSIKSATLRSRPHVTQELREVITPRFAYGDTPTAVVFIGRKTLVKAPSFHRCPRKIFTRHAASVIRRHAVGDEARAREFCIKASATSRAIRADMRAALHAHGAAIALTKICREVLASRRNVVIGAAQHEKSAETLPNIARSWHGGSIVR